jgi:hypothetical protein
MSASTDAAEINIGYLRRADPKSTLSLIQAPANNDGLAGARLAAPQHCLRLEAALDLQFG